MTVTGFAPNLRFMHCMRELDYLKTALRSGLMMTEHQVSLSATIDREEMWELIKPIQHILESKLQSLNTPLSSLSPERIGSIFSGIGNLSARVPMLCFTEVPKGKDLNAHAQRFGRFGLTVRAEWMAANGGDRVIYVGHNSPASQRLFTCLAIMRIHGLHLHHGEPMLDRDSLIAALSLLPYVEVRDHVEQAEWRIAGKTGLDGGGSETGKKIPISLNDIEHIFAPDQAAKIEVQSVVDGLADEQQSEIVPRVSLFPASIPD